VSERQSLSYRQILVGAFPTGMSGLDELFAQLYDEGKEPHEALGQELVTRARVHNYIPRSAQVAYATVLLKEYASYWQLRSTGQDATPKRPPWRGVPREQVPWFPTLEETLCDGCDKCLDFCANGVYAKQEDGTVRVVDPLNCVVGCDVCARLCRHRAITFPPRTILQTLGR